MKVKDLSLREKILQTVVIRVDKDNFNPAKVGATFFFGEIITSADEMGIDVARKTLAQYIDNADIPILITSDFENGCDMMLWPTDDYVDNMVEAVENGYIKEERLDDAVSRILNMKEKLGLFKQEKHVTAKSDSDKKFVADTQKKIAENSVTLIKDKIGIFPITPKK